jgi:hypothetical protein
VKLGSEPTVIIYSILAALNAVQVAVVNGPEWVNIVILAVTAALGALVNRSVVTPVKKKS